jgi:hypothetical protein
MGRLCAWAGALALLFLASCHQVQDCIDEQVTGCRNSHLARCAWLHSRGNYVDCRDDLWDFGAGFRYGYADILNGGRGCPPAVPPRCYWGCCYHNASGKCAIAAWYDGYHHGAAAALADGYGSSYGALPSSMDLYQQCAKRPVQLDVDQYKAAMSAAAEAQPGTIDPDPLPDDFMEPGRPGLPDEPYSPATLETPPELPVEPGPQTSRSRHQAGGPIHLSLRLEEER